MGSKVGIGLKIYWNYERIKIEKLETPEEVKKNLFDCQRLLSSIKFGVLRFSFFGSEIKISRKICDGIRISIFVCRSNVHLGKVKKYKT